MIDLNEYATKYNLTVETLQKIQQATEKKYKNLPLSESEKEKYVILAITNFCKQDQSLGLMKFNGLVLITPQPRDGVKKRRDKAVEEYQKDPEAAIRNGYVSEINHSLITTLTKDGSIVKRNVETIPKFAIPMDQDIRVVPLDNRATWQNGKKNFNYLKPLPTHQYFTMLEGLVFEDDKTLPFKMMYNTDSEHPDIPTGKVVEFKAKVNKTEPYLELKQNSKHTKFSVLKDIEATMFNVQIKNFYDSIDLSDIMNAYEHLETKYDVVSVEGLTTKIFKKEGTLDDPYQWATIILTSLDNNTIKILCHPSLSVDFDEGSYIKVWGTLSLGKKWDSDLGGKTDEDEITMFALGVFSMMNSEVSPDESEPELEDELEDEWEY